MSVRSVVKNLLGRLGLEIHRRTPTGWSAESLRRFGGGVRSVVDVGVGNGTPALYHAFPDAFFLLVEPLVEFESSIEGVLSQVRGVHFSGAAGEDVSERPIHVQVEFPERSSLQVRPVDQIEGVTLEKRMVQVAPLDHLMSRYDLVPPFGLKIDAEGHELDVLRGGGKFLEACTFVVAEVSVAQRFEDGYSFGEFVSFMEGLGFMVFDFLSISRSPGTFRTSQVDVVFLPVAS